MKRRLALAFAAALLAASHAKAQIADPSASPAARAVLDYVRKLGDAPERRVLSGQFLDFEPDATLALPESIHAQTGRWPAFIGVDYTNFKDQSIGWSSANRVAKEYWRQKGLVEVSTHLPDPMSKKGVGLRDRGVRLSALVREGSAENKAWLAELDRVAQGLSDLQDAGVVVFWRPFHEMNGGWFWWGAKPKAEFIALWRQTFEYMTRTKGLHNLIWVYSPGSGPDAADYYPGDAYVDMVGLDTYTDYVDGNHVRGFGALLKLDKPAGFGEYGPHGASDPPGNFDYTRFSAGLASSFPQAVFFMSWNVKWSPALNHRAREFYADPSLVTRADLPAALFR